jgi:hypothetical protein
MFRYLVRRYKWVHLLLGLLGNVCFFIGSILFLLDSYKTMGAYFFIVGSGGMLIGSVGQIFVAYEKHHVHD